MLKKHSRSFYSLLVFWQKNSAPGSAVELCRGVFLLSRVLPGEGRIKRRLRRRLGWVWVATGEESAGSRLDRSGWSGNSPPS